MVEVTQINQSYIHISCDLDVAMNISNHFSFYVEGYRWSPKYKAGIWSGKIKLFKMNSGLLPIGLKVDLLLYLKQNNIEFKSEIDNEYGPKISKKFIHKFWNELLKCDFELRDYQVEAIRQTLKYKKLILLSATGSGKSAIAFCVLNLLKYIDEDFKSLLVVPTLSLVSQMKEDFIEYGKNFCNYDEYIHIINGKNKDSDKPVSITTWQNIQYIKDKKWFAQWYGIIVDEVHGATAKQLSKIVNSCINSQFKIGMTGSLKECNTSKMQLKSLFSRIYSASKTKDLQKKNILSKLEIRNCILNYPREYRNDCKKFNYDEEINFIRSLDIRKKFVNKLVKRIKGNTLVLFRSIDYGREIYEMIKKKNEKTFFIYGGTKVEDRETARKIAEETENVVIVASFPIFSQGINIKRLHNLVFVESVKSLIKVVQSIGRVLRIHETKEMAILYDLVDDLSWKKRKNYVLRHFFKRISIYNEQEFNFKTKTFKMVEVNK